MLHPIPPVEGRELDVENILITGHEEELAAIAARIQAPEAEARQTAASWLRSAVQILEGEGPSMRAQLFGDQDPPDWRENEARRYMAKARHALLRARN